MCCHRLVFTLGLLLLAGPALPAADAPAKLEGESVIYPRNAPEGGRLTPRADDGFPLWGMVLVVAILAGGGFLLLKRGGLAPRAAGAGGQRLAIEETRPLGNKQFLAVATYGDRRLLLAVCPGKIDLLCRLDTDAAKGGGPATPESPAGP